MTNDTTTLAQRETPSLVQPEEPQVVTVTPRVDIYESQDEILLVADFPGVPRDSLWVGLDGSELVIEGAQLAHEGQPQIRPLAFSRTFRVPNTVDPFGEVRSGKAETNRNTQRLRRELDHQVSHGGLHPTNSQHVSAHCRSSDRSTRAYLHASPGDGRS